MFPHSRRITVSLALACLTGAASCVITPILPSRTSDFSVLKKSGVQGSALLQRPKGSEIQGESVAGCLIPVEEKYHSFSSY